MGEGTSAIPRSVTTRRCVTICHRPHAGVLRHHICQQYAVLPRSACCSVCAAFIAAIASRAAPPAPHPASHLGQLVGGAASDLGNAQAAKLLLKVLELQARARNMAKQSAKQAAPHEGWPQLTQPSSTKASCCSCWLKLTVVTLQIVVKHK
jgi:hypothetical protein